MKSIKELLTTYQGTEGQKLIQRKIYDTLLRESEKALIPRELAAIQIGPEGIPGSSVDIDYADKDSMAVRVVNEGAMIPIDVEAYSSFNMKPVKYGVRIPITAEMMEDAKWNLLEQNAKRAGIEMAENESSLIISDALDNATNTQSGSGAITVSDITTAMQYLEDADYKPTDIIFGPEIANDIRNIDTFVEADKAGITNPGQALIGRIFGMNLWMISGNIITSSYAYIIDRNYAFVIAEKRPLTIKNYDEVPMDMMGITVTQRIKVRQLFADAICKITT